jgi:hypothetical protein
MYGISYMFRHYIAILREMWKSRPTKCTINFLINLLLLHVSAPAWSHHQGVTLALKGTNRCGDLMDVIMWVCLRQGIAAVECLA